MSDDARVNAAKAFYSDMYAGEEVEFNQAADYNHLSAFLEHANSALQYILRGKEKICGNENFQKFLAYRLVLMCEICKGFSNDSLKWLKAYIAEALHNQLTEEETAILASMDIKSEAETIQTLFLTQILSPDELWNVIESHCPQRLVDGLLAEFMDRKGRIDAAKAFYRAIYAGEEPPEDIGR